MKIRNISKKDLKQIQSLALKSWLFTYKKIYSEKSIRKQVANYYSDKSLEKSLTKSKSKEELFIVAVENNKILGYAQVRKSKHAWDLCRIYVDPKIIGKGIGSKLIEKVEKFLKTKKVKEYTAYPHSKNPIAVNFYLKKGFFHFKKWDEGKTSHCYLKRISENH